MTYEDLMRAVPGLETIGGVRVTKVALRARRIITDVNAELARFRDYARTQAREAGIDDNDRNGYFALLTQLAKTAEVEEFTISKPVEWDSLPPDTLSGLEINHLVKIRALVGVPE